MRLECTIRLFYGMAINKFEKLHFKRQFLTASPFLPYVLLKNQTENNKAKYGKKNNVQLLKCFCHILNRFRVTFLYQKQIDIILELYEVRFLYLPTLYSVRFGLKANGARPQRS